MNPNVGGLNNWVGHSAAEKWSVVIAKTLMYTNHGLTASVDGISNGLISAASLHRTIVRIAPLGKPTAFATEFRAQKLRHKFD